MAIGWGINILLGALVLSPVVSYFDAWALPGDMHLAVGDFRFLRADYVIFDRQRRSDTSLLGVAAIRAGEIALAPKVRPMTLRPVRRALLSVSDKAGLVDFAKGLARHGVGAALHRGTADALRKAGLAVTDVSEVTGFPEIMDGRVKTLHPKIHGGFLAVRDKADHAEAMKTHGIEGIDLLVSNLYPFEATVAKGADFDETIENIDIGGPAMIRAASKNHEYVAVVVDTEDYAAVLSEMDANTGATTLGLRRKARADRLCAHGGL